MKKIICSIIIVISLLFSNPAHSATNMYAFTCLTGGTTGCLDKITGMTTGDTAIGLVSDVFYSYTFDSTCVTAESSPSVIKPDTGSGCWEIGAEYNSTLLDGHNAAYFQVAGSYAASNASTTVNGQTCTLGSSCTIETGSIASSISDGDTTHSPDGNSVFDALALKAPLSSPTFTGTVGLPTVNFNGLTASTPLGLDGSKNVVSITGQAFGDEYPVFYNHDDDTKMVQQDLSAITKETTRTDHHPDYDLYFSPIDKNFQPQQGTAYNYTIVTSVANDDWTVSLKTLAGNDPSASDPVVVRIGNVMHTITSALSVTLVNGFNRMNAGSAELAGQDIDYFIYLGYNATDGVVIGVSRIPWARIYSDFSTTYNNATYAKISTITNAAATDAYDVIGRTNAILSASADYHYSETTKVTINRPIYVTRRLTFTPVQTCFSGAPTTWGATAGYYSINNITLFLEVKSGITNQNNCVGVIISLPFAPSGGLSSGRNTLLAVDIATWIQGSLTVTSNGTGSFVKYEGTFSPTTGFFNNGDAVYASGTYPIK